MKQFLLVIFLSVAFLSISQNTKIIYSNSETQCEDGKSAAEADAKKEVFKLVSYGYAVKFNDIDEFNDYYSKYLEDNYGIFLISGGCVITSYNKCYREKIEELMEEKYGSDILKRIRDIAAKEYKSSEDYKNNIKVRIDTGYIFDSYRLHTGPKFQKHNKEFDFIKHLGFGNFEKDFLIDLKKYFDIEFIIEKDGSISNVSIRNAETHESIKNELLKKKIEDSSGWNPGIYFGEKVRTTMSYRIPLRLLK